MSMRHDAPVPTNARAHRPQKRRGSEGFSLLELLLVAALIGILATMILPNFVHHLADSKYDKAIAEINIIQADITAYVFLNDEPPPNLNALDRDVPTDPWGNNYRYRRLLAHPNFPNIAKKDEFGQPLNAQYDLWSKGPDGRSARRINRPRALDDVVRADEGGYVGIAAKY